MTKEIAQTKDNTESQKREKWKEITQITQKELAQLQKIKQAQKQGIRRPSCNETKELDR